ncbi:MAG: hypothetical protein J5J00_08795 [Deltaproteobacteria bacterium]|nr:hypothetical protein [Deltaproteobacteria bacterium]
MRFVISGEWTKNSLLRLIMFFFLFYIAFFWLTNLLLFLNKMSLSADSIIDYYRGSEQHYTQPRSYQGLLEISHFHLFAMGILILTLTHLLLFAPISVSLKAWLIIATFSSAFLDEAASWLVRFAHPSFAYLKIAAFIGLQLSLLLVMIIVLHALITKQPSAYTNSRSS